MTVRRKIMLIRLKGACIWPDVDRRLFFRASHAKDTTANKRSLDIRQKTEMDVSKPKKEPSVESISAPLAPVDPLGEALNFLRMSGMYYSRSELSEPWGIRLPTFPGCLAVHLRDERATPVSESDNYYVSHLDEPAYSPVIYGDGAVNAAHLV